jgi:O-antigen ligase
MPLNRMNQPSLADWELAINPGHGATILIVLIWPAMFALNRMRLALASALVASAAILSLQFGNYSNPIAFAAAAAAAALAWRWPGPTLLALGAGLAAAALAAPAVCALLPRASEISLPLPFSWAERIDIWRSAAARIGEQPWFGHGLDAARTMSSPALIRGETYHLISLHPHNAGLHIWLETGGVGACLFAAALSAGGWTAARALRDRREAAAAVAGGASAYAVHAYLSLGVWQEWWIATAFLLAAMIAALPGARQAPAPAG